MSGLKIFGKALAIGIVPFAASFGGAAFAQTPTASTNNGEAVPGAAFGSQTDAWLSMQLNPAYTANDPRPIPGEVANRTFSRYLDSFSHPIPEQFERQSFTGSGGGGGSNSSSNGSGSGSNSNGNP